MKRNPYLATCLNTISFGLGFLYMGVNISQAYLLGITLLTLTFVFLFLGSFSFVIGIIGLLALVATHIAAFIWILKQSKLKKASNSFQNKKHYFLFSLVSYYSSFYVERIYQ